MKTPDEIKQGMAVCATLDGDCEKCPYDDGKQLTCVDSSRRDALAYIIHLESRLAQVERERDAALSEWKRTKMDSEGMCWTCKHGLITSLGICKCISSDPCDEGNNWEWRGVCAENTKEQNKGEKQV